MDIRKNDEVRDFLKTNSYPIQYNDGLLAFLRSYYNKTYSTLPDLLSRYRNGANTNVLPSLLTNLVETHSLPSSFTFTRASTGTYFDVDGTLQTATTDTPRFAYKPSEALLSFTNNGLLLEAASTNECTYSEDLTDASWSKTNTTISANAYVAPDGNTTADAIIENAGTGSKILGKPSVVTVTAGDFVTYSFFAKQGPGSVRYIRSTLSGTAISGLSNMACSLVDGTSTSDGTDTIRTRSFLLNNDWYRFEFTVQASSNGDITITNRNTTTYSLNEGSFTGDGVSGTVQWGHQVEVNEYLSSYIPTTTAAVTRAADVLSISGGDFSGVFNATEGTFIIEAENIFDYYGTYFSVDDGTSNDEMSISRDASDNTVMTITDGGAAQMSSSLSGNTSELAVRIALAYKANDCQLAINGVTAAKDTSVTLPSVDRVRFGLPTANNIYLKCFFYFPNRIYNLNGHTTI